MHAAFNIANVNYASMLLKDLLLVDHVHALDYGRRDLRDSQLVPGYS